jgi:hypothetical protein
MTQTLPVPFTAKVNVDNNTERAGIKKALIAINAELAKVPELSHLRLFIEQPPSEAFVNISCHSSVAKK